MAGIVSIQINSVLKNKTENFNKIEKLLNQNINNKIDLIIFPEFFATNNDYMNNFEPENGGETIKFVCDLAKKYQSNIIAGTVVREKNDGLYNTSFAINRKGEVVQTYDKVHLFNYFGGTEGQRIKSGNKISVVDFDFAKIGVVICFDIRYLSHFKKLMDANVDVIVLPTAWLLPNEICNSSEKLLSEVEMWKAMCKTRAYDNIAYFVVSNQVGNAAKNLSGIGTSMIISPTGEILQNANMQECAIYEDIDINLVRKSREIFPISEVYKEF